MELITLITFGSLLTYALAPIDYIMISRKNVEWGVPDTYLMVFDEALSDISSQAFIFLPMTNLYAKITPPKIEATCFAFLASASNFSGIGGTWLGSWVNTRFVGVTKDNLDDYWKLLTITYVCTLIPIMCRFWLIPSNK